VTSDGAAPSHGGAARPPGHDPLPFPAVTWGGPEALAAIDAARPCLPTPLPEAHVVSVLTAIVARAGQYAVKVHPPGTDAGHLERVGDALAGSSSAVVPLHQPVATEHGVVSLLPWLEPAAPVGWPDVGALLRQFHTEHAGAAVAPWTPLRRVAQATAGLAAADQAVLLGARDTLLAVLAGLDWLWPPDVIHGDVSPSNVMRAEGRPVLVDVDFVAVGPREYDLASAALRRTTGEIDRSTWLGFCRAYGADVLGWSGLPVLHRVMQLGAVAFSLWDCQRSGRPLDWMPDVVAGWRTPL